MTTVADTLLRDLNQRIEEVIKVDQDNEAAVFSEITDYVATDRIRRHYRDLFRAVAEAPSDPHEGIGVWVSGFFGSGKSSFAKNFAYVLQNPTVQGVPAAELFQGQIHDDQIDALIDSALARIRTDAILFDVRVNSRVLQGAGHITELMYTALLKELKYAEDYEIAELEIELESEGKLEQFTDLCRATYDREWAIVRKGGQRGPRASALLHKLDPGTYTDAEAWVRMRQGSKQTDLTINAFVGRTFELMTRRRPGRTLLFVLDEVGAYVARSAEKIEDLRAVVERFGVEGRNRVKAGTFPAPVWIIVTAQERLDEVVAAIDSKRVELARLQDRFKFTVDLAPADIREVATKRVLAKRPEAEPELAKLFTANEGRLNDSLRWERTSRKFKVNAEDFRQFYPYPPHFIDLSIDIMAGIRLQPGAQTQVGGSNRTIIKQAYEMLVSDRTAVASKPLGSLVTIDLVYELVEAHLRSEKQMDIASIRQQFDGHPDDPHGLTERVAKVVCLLEFVRDLPRTPLNIAACLVGTVGEAAPVAQVSQALDRLREAQFVRETEQGWKLQTPQEKNWDTEKRAISPKPRDRNETLRETVKEIFAEPELKTYRYRGIKIFKVGVALDNVRIEDGDIPVVLALNEDPDGRAEKIDQIRKESREKARENDVFWVFSLTPEIETLTTRLYASRQMIARYDQHRAQSKITNEEAASLQNEKVELVSVQGRLRDHVVSSLEQGVGMFRGLDRDAASLGSQLSEILKKQFDYAAPDLYPKLPMGARTITGNPAEEVLKAAHLNALSPLFYGSDRGLNLIVEGEGGRYSPNTSAETAREILDYIKREHAYGTKVTGKMLDEHFTGIGYGWERAVIQVVLAVLLRAGAIEVTHQGKRFRNHQDPQSREPLTSNVAFRSASFAPRAAVDLKTLTTAVQRLEELTGEEVDIEESAIAQSFQKLATAERQDLLGVLATAQANHLPVVDALNEYRETLDSVLNSPSDDCVRILAGEGNSFKESRERVRRIQRATTPAGLEAMQLAQTAASRMWPALRSRVAPDAPAAVAADRLIPALRSPTYYEHLDEIATDAKRIVAAYRTDYETLHRRRNTEFGKAIDLIKGTEAWLLLDQKARETGAIEGPDAEHAAREDAERLLQPLTSRVCRELDLPSAATDCRTCGATLAQMDSDLLALSHLERSVQDAVLQRAAPPEPEEDADIQLVRIADFFGTSPFADRGSVDDAIAQLRAYLYEKLDSGVRIMFAYGKES